MMMVMSVGCVLFVMVMVMMMCECVNVCVVW